MKEFTIKELNRMTDDMILKAIGDYVRSVRLKKDYTQAQLADRAGIHRTTIRDLELGRRSTLITLIQCLRALDALDILKDFKVSHEISPLELAKIEMKERKRASGDSENNILKSDW